VAFDEEKIRAQLRKWQERLLDLTKSNPLLGLNRARVSKLRVIAPDPQDLFRTFVLADEPVIRMPLVWRKPPGPLLTQVETTEEAPALQLEPGDVEFDATAVDLMRRLRRIYDNARTTVEERGVTTLYLTFGTLQWRDEGLGESTSPLWMIPCELTSTGPTTALRLKRSDDEMQLNPALEVYLRERHKVSLPPIPEEPDLKSLSQFLEDANTAVREQGWTVSKEVWLSTYTFEALVIHQDLKAMSGTAVANRIVAAFARASTGGEGSEAIGSEDGLDVLPTPEKVPVPVLPTDSSQLAALTYAKSGRNLVVHGPPGTGKSQTISSLIADALGRNQKVLFVSAKMAALNVVFQRLADKGLGRFCLEAHSTKAGKVKIIDDLRRALASEEAGDAGSLSDELQKLTQLREKLNAYVQDLHRKIDPLGLTPYQAIGRLAKLRSVPDLRFSLPWEKPLLVGRADFDAAVDALGDMSSQAPVFDERARHPWRGFSSAEMGLSVQQSIEHDLEVILNAIRKNREALGRLIALLPFPDETAFAEVQQYEAVFEALAEVDSLPLGWWTLKAGQLNEKADVFEESAQHAGEITSFNPEYEAILDLTFADGRTLLLPVETEFASWLKRISLSYLRWRSKVQAHLRPGAAGGFRSLARYYLLATRLAALDGWISEHQEQLVAEVGPSRVRDARALSQAARQFRAAALIQTVLAQRNLQPPEGLRAVAPDMRSAAREVLANLPKRNKPLQMVISRIDFAWPEGFVEGVPIGRAPFTDVISRSQTVIEAPERIHEWLLLQRTILKCKSLGLGPLLDSLGTVSARLAPAIFERRFYALWADASIGRTENLANFGGHRREEQIRKFRELDERVRNLSLRYIRSEASRPARRVSESRDDLGSASEVGILRHELGKRRRIKPLRKLFAEIPHVLQALKPCMLMSPISVSTFLKPGAIEFDLVVFDEASQLPTAETIPSILRAKQVIVAGDANQLPPTSFFAASIFADEDAEEGTQLEFEPLESLLDDSVAVVPTFQEAYLRWHYRSRDERLIKFSNHYFYDNRLTTFPSPSVSEEGRGVRLVYVEDGVWDRGKSRTNRREARRVAELVVEHLDQFPDRSLGVVAMNMQQREAIEDAIGEQLLDRPDLIPLLSADRPEPYFVKSLENVQGDERDTMITSVGYGKDPTGALTFNFGPLNMEGGWRRLNVLVTRAKWQTILVTSLRSHQLHGVNPLNRGAVALKNYIEYAERHGELSVEQPSVTDGETNDFEDCLRQALVDRGLSVDQQVGASRYRIDLAIRHRNDPTRYALGIECDGATYHAARSARDRDLLRQEVLRSMQWRLHRVWSTDWFRDPEGTLDSILRSLEQAEIRALEEMPEVPARALGEGEGHDHGAQPTASLRSRKYTPGARYRRFRPQAYRSDRDALLKSEYVNALARDVTAIVGVEGPIHVNQVAARLKEMHQVERLGSTVQANIDRAIDWAIRTLGRVARGSDTDFLVMKGETLKTFRIPGDGIERQIQFIAPEEIALAILHLVEDQFGMFRDQIPTAVVKLFGLERAGPEAADIIRNVLEGLVDSGRLRIVGLQVYLP